MSSKMNGISLISELILHFFVILLPLHARFAVDTRIVECDVLRSNAFSAIVLCTVFLKLLQIIR